MEKQRTSVVSDGRRKILVASPLILLAGCDLSPEGRVESWLRSFQKFNDWIQQKTFDPARLSPEAGDEMLTPEEGFRLNSYSTDEPDIDLAAWRLEVKGLVRTPASLTLAQIAALPRRVMNTRHCCVEGWSMIVKWGGTPLGKLLTALGADPSARYLYVECADDYYTTYDMASAMHPQTLLCYEAYGKPLSLGHGAPLRITMPVKLGYKSAKWVRSLEVTNEKRGGYWEDQGYDWFAGL